MRAIDLDAPPRLHLPRAALAPDARADLIVAVLLATILSLAWTLQHWGQLRWLLLPDPDDMMRLAQVRDWIGGQALNDWTQYRMAPPTGAPMHWSRIADAPIAALILIAAPLLGRDGAELFAVIAWPALLFAAALYLSARIGRRLWGPDAGLPAAVLTALAYPGTTIFLPGRIDHHALQAVLVQLFVLALMRAPTLRNGLLAGGVAGVSLVVGLETAPQVAALIAVLFLLWGVRGGAERGRMLGFAGALGGVTLFCLALLRPTYWNPGLCDAFTPASSTGALLGSGALALLGWATPRLGTPALRLGTGSLLGGTALGATLIVFPACVSGPYGAVDPFLLEYFIPHIDEANGIGAQRHFGRALSLAGVLAAGCAASLWMLARDRTRWAVLAPIAAVVLMSGLVLLVQVRGTYIGAPLAAPVLAGLVVAARTRDRLRLPALLAAWLAGSGMAWLELPRLAEKLVDPGAPPATAPTPQQVCGDGAVLARIDQMPAGVVLAPTSMASYLIGATRHATVGAGYHRNNAGNMAMYRFFLGPQAHARAIARAWRADYVVFCPGDFSEIGVPRTFAGSLGADLARGRAPGWLEPVPTGGALRLYRIH